MTLSTNSTSPPSSTSSTQNGQNDDEKNEDQENDEIVVSSSSSLSSLKSELDLIHEIVIFNSEQNWPKLKIMGEVLIYLIFIFDD